MSQSFRSRLDAMMRATELSAGQLGVARVYESPIYSTPSSPPLLGEEVLLKDLNQVAGEVTSMGSARLSFVAEHSDSAARRLLDAGAVLVGSSMSAEFGTTAYTEPVGMDEPVNPIDAAFMAGGSSGGAAVAVARGLVRLAHASDGGGSIRIPAACCGLVGLKPAHDHRAADGFSSMAQGFIAADFAATRQAYELSSGDVPPGVRVGYTNRPFHSSSEVDPRVAAATAAVAGLLATHPQVEGVSQAPAPYDRGVFQAFSEFLAQRCASLPGELSPLTSWLRERGREIPAHHRDMLIEHILAIDPLQRWAELDVVVTPTLACAPPAPGTFSAMSPQLNFLAQTAWTPWATLWNLKGWASVTVPVVDPARVPGRWPIALLLGAVDGRVSEADLLDLAEHVQAAAAGLPPEMLSLAEPGDIDNLNFQPRPTHEH